MIIVEDGKPSVVMIDVDEYLGFEKIKEFTGEGKSAIKEVNKDINIWKNRQEEKKLKRITAEDNFGVTVNRDRKDREQKIVINRL